MLLYTDYPLFEEERGKIAPIREVTLLSYDGDKYVHIVFNGKLYEVKACYIYYQKGRLNEVPQVSYDTLKHITIDTDEWFAEYDKYNTK